MGKALKFIISIIVCTLVVSPIDSYARSKNRGGIVLRVPKQSKPIELELKSPLIMVLLEKNFALGSEINKERLFELFSKDGETNITFAGEGENKTTIINWAGLTFAAFTVDNPIPRDTFYASLQSSRHKKELSKIVDKHRAHLVVSILSESKHFGMSIDQSLMLSLFVEKIVQLVKPVGYFWSAPEKLVQPDVFADAVSETWGVLAKRYEDNPDAKKYLPFEYWVDIRAWHDDNKSGLGFHAARTEGLDVFTGYEIEIAFLKWPPDKVKVYLKNLVGYLFLNGPILKDGDTLKISDSEIFRMSFEQHFSTGEPNLMLKIEKSSN